ncbi:MAG: DUF1684 domain-containing protein [Candidatus Limnocylindrales bacterium]
MSLDHHEQDEHADHEGHDHAGHQHVSYADAIANYRADKDEYFREEDGSPVPEAERPTFLGIPYFAVDEALRFDGLTLEPYTGSEPVAFQIPTSDGQLRDAERAGVFRFQLNGVTQALTAYTFAKSPSESLFVPFLDVTSGTESYGAGRYLDVYPERDGSYALDFNLAYHPSCVYDPHLSCPLTPAENRLPLRIEAGERLASSESSAR